MKLFLLIVLLFYALAVATGYLTWRASKSREEMAAKLRWHLLFVGIT